jgi:hypothetical protein
MQTQNITA